MASQGNSSLKRSSNGNIRNYFVSNVTKGGQKQRLEDSLEPHDDGDGENVGSHAARVDQVSFKPIQRYFEECICSSRLDSMQVGQLCERPNLGSR